MGTRKSKAAMMQGRTGKFICDGCLKVREASEESFMGARRLCPACFEIERIYFASVRE